MEHQKLDAAGTPPGVPKLLGLKAAARYSGLNEWHLRDLVRSGDLAHVRVPSARMATGRMRGVKHAVRIVAPAGDPRVKPLRRYLIAVSDLDALVDRYRTAAEG